MLTNSYFACLKHVIILCPCTLPVHVDVDVDKGTPRSNLTLINPIFSRSIIIELTTPIEKETINQPTVVEVVLVLLQTKVALDSPLTSAQPTSSCFSSNT
jgi:hypothetical protein